MRTFDQFKETFDEEVGSARRSDSYTGIVVLLLGVKMILLTAFKMGRLHETMAFSYIFFSFFIVLGLIDLYWIKIRYKFSSFKKERTNDEVERGIEEIIKRHRMDILKHTEDYYSLFYKPGFWASWAEVHLFYNADTIYINARFISREKIDFE